MSSSSRGDERTLFERAMRGVRPLTDRGDGPQPPRRRPKPATADAAGGSVRFEINRYGEHVEGVAAGVAAEVLTPVLEGKVAVDLELDLHGLPEAEARLAVRDLLRRAWRTGSRCVRIVHGRGLGSPDEPVLKQAVPGWLAEAPHGARILAFTTAGRLGGRGGATVVLVRGRR